MRYQRDYGLFGALIVRESQRDIHAKLGPFEDQPERKTLALLEKYKNSRPGGGDDPFCLPDGSTLPKQFDSLSFFVNGKKVAKDPLGGRANESHSEFYVVPGKNYRFRIIGSMESAILIISIDYHKMHVIATDGYLVEKFETDFLIVHVGERYDFILEAKIGVKPGTKYPINIQTLAVKCDNNSEIAGESFAFIVYTDDSGSKEQEMLVQQTNRCEDPLSPCFVLNCPFRIVPNDYNQPGTYMQCFNILSLQLLYPTLPADIPSSNTPLQYFYNFEVDWPNATINGIRFTLPVIPPVENNGYKHECEYPVQCENRGMRCTHAVYLNNYTETARFVLSSIIPGKQDSPSITHPIHMHGHTYFIAKIGYPEYSTNGTIIAPNTDVKVPSCGHGNWRDGIPKGISVKNTTIRKDTVIIPAGGYVVIHFIENNPGYWFMHCHIDDHLNHGMAIAIGENHKCASTPPDPLYHETDKFCFTVKTFLEKEEELSTNEVCPLKQPRSYGNLLVANVGYTLFIVWGLAVLLGIKI